MWDLGTISLVTSVACLVVVALVLGWLRTAVAGLRRDLEECRQEQRGTERRLMRAVEEASDAAVTASCIGSLGFRFPVFLGGPSIDSHHARALMFLLQDRRPRTILELGSGSSTVLIARTLQALGSPPALHISVDHEDRFLRNTMELARLNGVESLIRFELCPLEHTEGRELPWYSRISEVVGGSSLDLVVIDGPPAYRSSDSRAREPAMKILRPLLSDSAVVVLDDANRQGEADIVGVWERTFPEFKVHRVRAGKGIAIFSLEA